MVRYVIGLQDTKDPCCYKDVLEGDKQGETIEKAQNIADKEKRKTIVYDRKEMLIIHRCESKTIKLSDEKATVSSIKKIKRK